MGQAANQWDLMTKIEGRSMRLVLDVEGVAESGMPDPVAKAGLSEADQGLSPDEKGAEVRQIMLDGRYLTARKSVLGATEESQETINVQAAQKVTASRGRSATMR